MNKARWLLISLVCVLLLSLSCSSADVPEEIADSYLSDAYLTTVLTAGVPWDIDTNSMRLGTSFSLSDLEWVAVTATERLLTPKWGTKLMLVSDTAFEDIDDVYIAGQSLTPDEIPGASLAPGAIVIFKTQDGLYGKLLVEKYYSSHELSFPDAENIEPAAKEKLLAEGAQEMYNVQVKWTVYKLEAK